jgi:cytochrome P450
LVFPKLETWFPRKHVIRKIDDLVKDFGQLLEDKKQRPGNDMLTYMIEEVRPLRFMSMTIFG